MRLSAVRTSNDYVNAVPTHKFKDLKISNTGIRALLKYIINRRENKYGDVLIIILFGVYLLKLNYLTFPKKN